MSAPDKPRRKRRRTEHEEPRETGAPVISGEAPALVEVAPSTFAYDPGAAQQALDALRVVTVEDLAIARHEAAVLEAYLHIDVPDGFPDDLSLAVLQGLRAFLAEAPGRRVDAWAVRDGYLVVVAYPDAQKRRFRL